MEQLRNNKERKQNIRYNIITILIYLVGIVLITQLFNLQIVQGKEYREKSNTRLSRESILEAARGDILDQSGNKLATTALGYSLELYKTKLDNKELNKSLLKIAQVLEANGDAYIDDLPIKINPFEFTIGEDSIKRWKKENKFAYFLMEKLI